MLHEAVGDEQAMGIGEDEGTETISVGGPLSNVVACE